MKTRSGFSLKEAFRVPYEKQVVYFVLLLLAFFGFTEIMAVSFIRKMEYKWMLSKETEFEVVRSDVAKILTRPEEEARSRLKVLTESPNLRRIVIIRPDGDVIHDTSPFSEKVTIPPMEHFERISLYREAGFIAASYWARMTEAGAPVYLVLFSPREEMPYFFRLLRINSFIRIAGTILGFLLGIYFITFVLSPFRKMGEAAMVLKKKDISSVEEIVATFNESMSELRRLYALEKRKVSRMEKEMSLKEHLASLGEMSAGIAHEFRNALGSIIGFTDLALKQRGKDDYLQKVKDEAEALNSVVTEFLFFAKPQKLQKEQLNLRDELTALVKHAPENIAVTLQMDEIPDIFADRHLMKRAFSNILVNAYESMPDGGAVSISSEFHPRKGMVTVSVKDEGRGISSRIRKEVFTPFFSTKADGAGLGLSIVYKVVTLHNGSVRIRSSRKGTVVDVELPMGGIKGQERMKRSSICLIGCIGLIG
jgi:signal transduction histidine kinase